MSGTVKQFVDFSDNTNNDTGENTATSIQRIDDGETLNQGVLRRPSESLRQRTEALKNVDGDTLYLRDADRSLIIAGPGRITWPGSTTALATGIPALDDTLYLLPMLTPGFAQAAPVPPVASAYGTLHLKRADSVDAILVTSQRRSYAAGDQINITVTPGGAFSVTLDVETGYERTIAIVATGATTLTMVINALNALLPTAPDNTQLVTAALEGGAIGADLLLTTQAKQFVAGNYDGEGHAITPANVLAFFTANPGSALAEGDTLGIWYAMVSDTATTGGRRQSTPENANTAVPVGSYFNSRVEPAKIVNSIPICKVVDGALVFGTGVSIPAGGTTLPLNYTLPDRISLGLLSLGSAADARLPRLSTPHAGPYPVTLLWDSTLDGDAGDGPGVGPVIRVYGTAGGELSIVVNASYTGAAWAKDVVTSGATMMTYRASGVEMFSRTASAVGTWASWDKAATLTGPKATVDDGSPVFVPMLQLFDGAGNRRVGFDHLGYARRPMFQLHQNWIAPMLAAWTAAVTGAATNVAETGFNGNMPGVWLKQSVAANTEIARIHSPSLFSGSTYDNLISVLEFTLESTDLAGAALLTYQIGLIHDESVEPSTEDFVKIYKTTASANWIFRSYGSVAAAGSDIDTGIAATGLQRFRIELHGTGSPGGKRALLWIDGVFAGEITADLPDGQDMKLSSFFRSDGALVKNVYVSAINFSTHRTLTDDPV